MYWGIVVNISDGSDCTRSKMIEIERLYSSRCSIFSRREWGLNILTSDSLSKSMLQLPHYPNTPLPLPPVKC